MMQFACPHCERTVSSEAAHAGQVVLCPHCNKEMMLPPVARPVSVKTKPVLETSGFDAAFGQAKNSQNSAPTVSAKSSTGETKVWTRADVPSLRKLAMYAGIAVVGFGLLIALINSRKNTSPSEATSSSSADSERGPITDAQREAAKREAGLLNSFDDWNSASELAKLEWCRQYLDNHEKIPGYGVVRRLPESIRDDPQWRRKGAKRPRCTAERLREALNASLKGRSGKTPLEYTAKVYAFD